MTGEWTQAQIGSPSHPTPVGHSKKFLLCKSRPHVRHLIVEDAKEDTQAGSEARGTADQGGRLHSMRSANCKN